MVRDDDTGVVHLQLLVALNLKVNAVYVLEGLDAPTDEAHILRYLATVTQQAGDHGHGDDDKAVHAVQGDLGLELGHAAQLHKQQQEQQLQQCAVSHGQSSMAKAALGSCMYGGPLGASMARASGFLLGLWLERSSLDNPYQRSGPISAREKPKVMKAREVNCF